MAFYNFRDYKVAMQRRRHLFKQIKIVIYGGMSIYILHLIIIQTISLLEIYQKLNVQLSVLLFVQVF
jgi:hypothetical protein